MRRDALYPQTLKLLDSIVELDELSPYTLVGGTALALHLGHRKSIDLDFFTLNTIDYSVLLQVLEARFKVEVTAQHLSGLNLIIDDVKCDLLRHNYTWLEPTTKLGNTRLASLEDIAAMKLNAICGRGSKKDFIDIYILLRQFSLNDVIRFYRRKYPNRSLLMAYKSLVYFEDAEREPSPEMIEPVEWFEVKETILEQVQKLNI